MPTFSGYQNEIESDYPELRECLSRQLQNLPDEQLEALFEHYNLSAEDIESFFDSVKKVGKAVAGAAPTVLPIAGTVVGAMYGSPHIGAALGGMAGTAVAKATGPKASPAPSSQPGPPAPQLPPGGSPAAGQLIQIMFRPETLQALIQMLLGHIMGSNVAVGRTPVPVEAFTNLVGTMANQAQAEYHAAHLSTREELPEYLRDDAGGPLADPAVAEQRAHVLAELLQETDLEQDEEVSEYDEAYDEAYDEEHEEEAFYIELELAELYSEADDW